jgi:MBOAT, membrane-bound O-acyltransferase family
MSLHWLSALRHMAILLSLRLLPFTVWSLIVRPSSFGGKACIAAGYAVFPLIACYLGAGSSVLLVGVGAAYYLALCFGASGLSARMATGQVTKGAAIVLVFLAFLLAPGIALPGEAIATFLVVGWELALSTYSYCVETSRPGVAPAPMSECLFFLLVNPTLVYTSRGAPLETRVGHLGFVRAVVGAALMFVNVSVVWSVADYLHTAGESPTRVAIVAWSAYGIVRFLSVYAAHSGLASIHIGLMHQLGWRVPERYDHPLAAASPTDFWRRWNTYVRTWLEAYVFLPIARSVARRTRRRAGQAAAAMATLVVSGLIHDAYVFAGRQTTAGLRMTRLFLGACAVLMVWYLAANLVRAVRARLGEKQTQSFDLATAVLSRFSLAVTLVGAAIVWGLT